MKQRKTDFRIVVHRIPATLEFSYIPVFARSYYIQYRVSLSPWPTRPPQEPHPHPPSGRGSARVRLVRGIARRRPSKTLNRDPTSLKQRPRRNPRLPSYLRSRWPQPGAPLPGTACGGFYSSPPPRCGHAGNPVFASRSAALRWLENGIPGSRVPLAPEGRSQRLHRWDSNRLRCGCAPYFLSPLKNAIKTCGTTWTGAVYRES